MSPPRYDEELLYFNEVLQPDLDGDGECDPCGRWTEYALRIADAISPGTAVSLDETGLRQTYDGNVADQYVVLHIPDESRGKVSMIRAPNNPTPAQQACIGVLTEGWRSLPS